MDNVITLTTIIEEDETIVTENNLEEQINEINQENIDDLRTIYPGENRY